MPEIQQNRLQELRRHQRRIQNDAELGRVGRQDCNTVLSRVAFAVPTSAVRTTNPYTVELRK